MRPGVSVKGVMKETFSLLGWEFMGLGLCRAWFIGCMASSRVSTGQTSAMSMLGYGCFIIGVAVFIALAHRQMANARPSLDEGHVVLPVAAGLLGTASLAIGAAGGQVAYALGGVAAIGVSAGLLEATWTFRLVRLDPARAYLNILAVMLVSSLADFAVESLPVAASVLSSLALLIASALCFGGLERGGHQRRKRVGPDDGPPQEALRQDPDASRLLMRIVGVCFVYCIVHMVSVSIGRGVPGESALLIRSAANLTVTAALVGLFAWRRQLRASMLFRAIPLVTVLGLILQYLAIPGSGAVSYVVLCAGNKLYDILSLVLLSRCMQRYGLRLSSEALFTGLLVASRSAGNLAGLILLRMAAGPWLPLPFMDELPLVMVMPLLLCFFWLLSERTMFDCLGDAPAPVKEPRADGVPGIGRVVDELSIRCGLTPREREVLALLARGKNQPSIMKELSISKGTAHAHTAHIYQKMGVHGQQELIELVESRMAGLE